MAKRILFVPFALSGHFQRPGYDYVGKNNAWIAAYQKKAVADDGDTHDIYQCFYSGNRSALIAGLGADDQLYIRGHCLPGFEGIFDHTAFDEQGRRTHVSQMDQDLLVKLEPNEDTGRRPVFHSIRAPEVFRRMRASGLQPGFAGAIKCYNCHSAEAEDGETSFAQAMLNELRGAGYDSCTVYGYRGALSSFHDGSGHKTSTAGGRASANRVKIG